MVCLCIMNNCCDLELIDLAALEGHCYRLTWGCLQALSDHDTSRCLRLIHAGQFSIIQLLANAGTDSIARSNPLIVQLQLLAAAAEVQQMQASSMPQAGRSLCLPTRKGQQLL